MHYGVGNLAAATFLNYAVLCNTGLASLASNGPLRAIYGWTAKCQRWKNRKVYGAGCRLSRPKADGCDGQQGAICSQSRL